MAIKLSIIGVDRYTIPCLKANILPHAVKLKLGYCHNCGLFSSQRYRNDLKKITLSICGLWPVQPTLTSHIGVKIM